MKKILLLITVLAIGCKKEQLVEEPPVTNYPTEATLNLGSTVHAKFFGVVKDESGSPVSGVAITAGDKTATTDNNGVFMISNASVNEKLAYVTAVKSGYFLGSRSVIPSTTATNNIRITLLTKDIAGTVNSGEEKTISLPDGAKVDFKGEYVDATGNVYTGSVNVSFKYMPPMADATADQMPGMLYAQNKDEEAGVLETYGMIAVELTGSTGEKLQIAEGSNATIHMPLDAAQSANAPATIPLWHFDEVAGYWIEGGEATLINGEYVGDVTHFSFWNCDAFSASALVLGWAEDQNGFPLSNVAVFVITPNASTIGHTSSDGTFYTYIPSNQAIIIEVDNQCGNPLETFNVGPYATGSANSETFAVPLTTSNSVQVTGVFYDCNNNLVTDGYVLLNVGSEEYTQILTNGTINMPVLFCNVPTTLTVQGFDYNSLQETSLNTVPLVSPVTDLGNLIACNSVSEYINYAIDSNPPVVVFAPISCASSSDTISIEGTTPSNGFVYLRSASQTVGSYNFDYNTGMTVSMSGGIPWWQSSANTDIIFNLNNFGPVGGYVDITFSGTYDDYNNINHTITGTVHVFRDS
ncbi:MAG: hypothetical protein GC178_16840 [Flavobacteriales bacterium]|nr:hypothetical protein [Flavobacteriales bacterium]